MFPTVETNVIVVWPWAKRQKKIKRYIRKNFFVLDEFVGLTSMREFYGIGPEKVELVQAFIVRTVYVRQPRQTTTGKRLVNPIMFDTKQTLRKWGGKKGQLNSVHASDDQEEAVRNIYNLLPEYAPSPHMGAVVLREGDDVDVLVGDLNKYVSHLGALRIDGYNVIGVDEEDVKYKYVYRQGDQLVVLDIRTPGDGYMDPRWQQAILDTGDYDEYAQLYHALIHKGQDGDMNKLLDYMSQYGYEVTRPTDPYFVQFNSLIGQVVEGHGVASTDPQPGMEEKWVEACGFSPFPGTLNIKYEGKFQLPKPHHTSSMVVYNVMLRQTEQEPLHFWHAKIKDQDVVLSVGGNRPNEVEVLAPVNLRETLRLENGDKVVVVVNEA